MFFTENHLDEKVCRKRSKETGMFLQSSIIDKKKGAWDYGNFISRAQRPVILAGEI